MTTSWFQHTKTSSIRCRVISKLRDYTKHYSDVIMSTMASRISGASIVCSTVCSGADQRKHQSSASLACVRGIHRWRLGSLHKGPVLRKMLPFDDVVMRFLFDELKFDRRLQCHSDWQNSKVKSHACETFHDMIRFLMEYWTGHVNLAVLTCSDSFTATLSSGSRHRYSLTPPVKMTAIFADDNFKCTRHYPNQYWPSSQTRVHAAPGRWVKSTFWHPIFKKRCGDLSEMIAYQSANSGYRHQVLLIPALILARQPCWVSRPISQIRAPPGGLSRTSGKLWQDYSNCYMLWT